MKNSLTGQAVVEAQKLLIKSPFDSGHDVRHHTKVWENVLKISFNENLTEKIDWNVLEIATWWHDYERGSTEHLALQKTLKKLNADENFIKSVLKTINSHSFHDDGQFTLESKVLFDADKIEYVSFPRWYDFVQAHLSGIESSEAVVGYCENLNKRLAKVVETLYFTTTRDIFKTTLVEFIKLLPQLDALLDQPLTIDKKHLNQIYSQL